MNMTTVPSNQLKAMQHEIADLKEQITNAKYNYLGAMADCKQYEETIAQQAEAIEKLRDHIELSLEFCDEEGFCVRDNLENALAIQPSPDILQARDEQVAEACAKLVNRFIGGDGILNDTWVHEIEDAIRSGEWMKYL